MQEILASAGPIFINVVALAVSYGKLTERLNTIDKNGSAFVREKIESIEKNVASLQLQMGQGTVQAGSFRERTVEALSEIKTSIKEIAERLQNAELQRARSTTKAN
jgi:hypothetical protein